MYDLWFVFQCPVIVDPSLTPPFVGFTIISGSFVETVDACPAERNIAVPANVNGYTISVTANNLAGSSMPAQQSE